MTLKIMNKFYDRTEQHVSENSPEYEENIRHPKIYVKLSKTQFAFAEFRSGYFLDII